MYNLGYYLRKIRKEKDLSLQKVQENTGITDSRLSKAENGSWSNLKILELKKLADLYEKPVITMYLMAGLLSKSDIEEYHSGFRNVALLGDDDKQHIQAEIDYILKKKEEKKKKPMIFRLGELFCGPGGIGWGAINADIGDENFGIVHQWANDYDESTCETYRHNICPNNPETVYHGDIRTLDMDQLAPIDALAFGFPCNDYSVVGEQKGIEGTFGPLYSYGVKALKKFRPQWFLAENVGGLRSANKGETLTKILNELRGAGYTITPHLYKFEEYGIPQARHRLIIIGIRNDINVQFKVPSPAPYVNVDNTCRNAIENPPIPTDAFNNEPTKQSKQVIERLKYIKPGQNAFTAELPEELRLNVKGAKISQIYKRLDPDKPSYTVTGSGGGGTHIYHWKEPRALTNRERARLQTFPDNYEFIGTKESIRKQIGMAVPCQGAKIIFEAVLKCFAGIEYESVDASITE